MVNRKRKNPRNNLIVVTVTSDFKEDMLKISDRKGLSMSTLMYMWAKEALAKEKESESESESDK